MTCDPLRPQEITPDMTEFLRSLRDHACVGVVGGSDLPKICQQLAGGDEKQVHNLCEYVFAENGLVAFKGGLVDLSLVTSEIFR